MSNKCPADDQLTNYKKEQKNPPIFTTSNGAPVGTKNAVLTVGPRGPMLMQDAVFMDEMAHFNRERIPERVAHAKGAAHGYFEVTHDITEFCKADIFSKVGKQTPMFARLSTIGGEAGSADTARDPRGIAMKFYTEEGNWDLVGIHFPAFIIRDPMLFTSFMHTQKRNPQTNLKDYDAMWDFYSLRPESTHQVMFMYGDRGTPDGYRHMDGFGAHSFKMVNSDGNAVYCKFHLKCCQEIKNLSSEDAVRLAGEDPDYATRDLFNAIETGDCPAWNLEIQVMTFEQAEKYRFNPFDLTKVWPHGDFPRKPVGRIVLNRNPKNYFAEVEQVAFSPAHLVPGIELSPDKILQARAFAYTDTQFHRLGTNHIQLPINCPMRARPHNTQRAGQGCFDSQGDAPNYHPNSFNGPCERTVPDESSFFISGDVQRYDDMDEHNFDQPRDFWTKVLDEGGRKRMVANMVKELKIVKPFIRDRAINNFSQVHEDFGNMLRDALEKVPSHQT